MTTTQSKHEFKTRWDSNENGGGITFDDIANCAVEWGLCSQPRTRQIDKVLYSVLKSAGTKDCEDFKPKGQQE